MPITFFDYLKLAKRDLSSYRLIVFSGQSGAGKSTYLKFLVAGNPSFNSNDVRIHQQRPMQWQGIKDRNRTLIIDEVKTISELFYILKLLYRGNTLLVANHAPVYIFKLVKLIYSSCFFELDHRTEKITRYLSEKGYNYSHQAVADYCRLFGSNFIDLEIIIETAESRDFDKVYYEFLRFNNIKLSQNHFF